MIFADFELYEYLSDQENLVAQESASVLYFVESTLYSGRSQQSRAVKTSPFFASKEEGGALVLLRGGAARVRNPRHQSASQPTLYLTPHLTSPTLYSLCSLARSPPAGSTFASLTSARPPPC